MSKHETWRTREYWKKTGGFLIEEFVTVKRLPGQGMRCIDGVIVSNGKNKIHKSNFFDVKGQDIICIQTKKGRLGMYAMGQAFFSRELLKLHKPKSIRTVIVCGKNDTVLNKICKKHNMEVVVIPENS